METSRFTSKIHQRHEMRTASVSGGVNPQFSLGAQRQFLLNSLASFMHPNSQPIPLHLGRGKLRETSRFCVRSETAWDADGVDATKRGHLTSCCTLSTIMERWLGLPSAIATLQQVSSWESGYDTKPGVRLTVNTTSASSGAAHDQRIRNHKTHLVDIVREK